MELKNQETAMPTRKIAAVGISGAISVAIVAAVNHYWPGFGDQNAMVIGSVVTWIAATISGFMTRNKA